jgi:hypothetical protein
MLDKRAWIITGLLVLVAIGAYAVWLRRTRAYYNARSLSAARHHKETAPKTKTLHVEGCREDFIVSPGEIVEPRIAPGAPIDQFHTLYGQESREDAGIITWITDPYELRLAQPTPGDPGTAIQIALNGGHVVETLDGIELGLDSFGTILSKMRDRKIEVHERILRSGNNWILTLSMYSACGPKFRSEYFRCVPSDPRTDSLINRRAVEPNGQPGPLRSDIFMNKVSYDYILKTSDGKDDSLIGEPAEHN